MGEVAFAYAPGGPPFKVRFELLKSRGILLVRTPGGTDGTDGRPTFVKLLIEYDCVSTIDPSI